MGKPQHLDDSNEEDRAPINVRNVETKVWKDFKKLAVLHDMTIQDYLKYLVEQEKARVHISFNKK